MAMFGDDPERRLSGALTGIVYVPRPLKGMSAARALVGTHAILDCSYDGA